MHNLTFRNYFAAEMRKLRESAQSFARAYPELARQLNLTSVHTTDPYIERLLEGFAYLTAQIQQRLDDDLPEICETFLMQICPQFLRPFPAATIMQFQARHAQLQKTYCIPKGLNIQNKPTAEKIICQFRTTTNLNINPLKIIAVHQQEIAGGNILKLHFKTDAKINLKALSLNEISIYIHAEHDLASWILFALSEELKEIKINFPGQAISSMLQQHIKIKLNSMENTESLIPLTAKDFMGFQLLLEYFAFREKFYFFTIHGLSTEIFPENAQEFILEISTTAVFPKEYKLTAENFYLNCVPAVNLFVQAAEPIQVTAQRTQYPLHIDINNTEKIFTYSVDQVIGIDQLTGTRKEYTPFNSFLYHENKHKNYFYTMQRDQGEKFSQTYLIIQQAADVKEEILSATLTASNGHLPRAILLENSLLQVMKDLPSFIEVHNIIRPSQFLTSARKENYRWILLSHLTFNLQLLQDLEQLKQILTLYEWTGREDNQRRIAGISELTVKQHKQIMQGAFVQGLKFNLSLQEENFSSTADLYLFARLLHQFFILYVPLNMLIITQTTCLPSNKKFIWNSHS